MAVDVMHDSFFLRWPMFHSFLYDPKFCFCFDNCLTVVISWRGMWIWIWIWHEFTKYSTIVDMSIKMAKHKIFLRFFSISNYVKNVYEKNKNENFIKLHYHFVSIQFEHESTQGFFVWINIFPKYSVIFRLLNASWSFDCEPKESVMGSQGKTAGWLTNNRQRFKSTEAKIGLTSHQPAPIQPTKRL